MRRTTLALAAALAVAGCGDLLPPAGVEPYDYRTFATGEDGAPVALSFHWPRAQLPIRIYIADDDALRPALLRAMTTWEDALLYGEIRTSLVADSTTADIIVRNEFVVKPTGTLRLAAGADGCFGSTDFDADIDEGILTPPFRIRVSALTEDVPGLLECYDITVLHELGHALGIFGHSPDGNDVMHVNPTRATLSARDRATIETVYHVPTTLVPEPR